MKLALLFPGQGSQTVGMGRDAAASNEAARAVFAEADVVLGEPLSRLCFEGPEEALLLTANTQPALLATSTALLAVVRESLGESLFGGVVAAAGHSLGEYSALVAAGALSFAEALRLVRVRGLAMQDAVPPGVGAMAAVMGIGAAEVTALCFAAAEGEIVAPANFNGTQIVIAGHAAAVARASVLAEQKKGKVIPLKVSAPFHCALMRPAAEAMEKALHPTQPGPFAFPVYANFDANENRDPDRVKTLLVGQIAGTVRWEETVHALVRSGVTHALEVGPGKVLAGLCKRIDKSLVVLPAFDLPSIEASAAALRAVGLTKEPTMFRLDEKVALITGASRGIGRAVAEALASQGAYVVVCYGQREAEAQAVLDGIVAQGGKGEIAGFDVADVPAVEAAVTAIAKRLGRLDILVSNAGISRDGLFVQQKEEALDETLAVNLKGALASARASIKIMMRAKKGRVIFMSSVVGEMGNAGQTAYAASKAGIIGAAKSLAREYAKRNVTVNVIAPGFVATDMTHDLPEAARTAMLAAVPLGRVATPAEVAAAAVYLASDEAAYVTGSVLRVNGGMLI